MQQGFVANYRGANYPANIGPGNGDVVLFSDTEPPADHGFERGPAYWRKQVNRAEVAVLDYVRTVGAYRGERCLVLGDRGDRLHIAYLGHDAPHAEELGYWMVDRGAYEVVVARDEVTDIMNERVPHPAGPAGPPALTAGGEAAETPPADMPVARAYVDTPQDDHLVSDDMVGDEAIPSWDRPEPGHDPQRAAERQTVAAMNGRGPAPQRLDAYGSGAAFDEVLGAGNDLDHGPGFGSAPAPNPGYEQGPGTGGYGTGPQPGQGFGTGPQAGQGFGTGPQPGQGFSGGPEPAPGFGVGSEPAPGFGGGPEPGQGFGGAPEQGPGFGGAPEPGPGFGGAPEPGPGFGGAPEPGPGFGAGPESAPGFGGGPEPGPGFGTGPEPAPGFGVGPDRGGAGLDRGPGSHSGPQQHQPGPVAPPPGDMPSGATPRPGFPGDAPDAGATPRGPSTTPFPGTGPDQGGRLGEMVEDTAGALAGPRMPSGPQPTQEPDDGSWRAPPAEPFGQRGRTDAPGQGGYGDMPGNGPGAFREGPGGPGEDRLGTGPGGFGDPAAPDMPAPGFGDRPGGAPGGFDPNGPGGFGDAPGAGRVDDPNAGAPGTGPGGYGDPNGPGGPTAFNDPAAPAAPGGYGDPAAPRGFGDPNLPGTPGGFGDPNGPGIPGPGDAGRPAGGFGDGLPGTPGAGAPGVPGMAAGPQGGLADAPGADPGAGDRPSWASDPLGAPTPDQYADELPAWARDPEPRPGEPVEDPNLKALYDLGQQQSAAQEQPLDSTQTFTPVWDDDEPGASGGREQASGGYPVTDFGSGAYPANADAGSGAYPAGPDLGSGAYPAHADPGSGAYPLSPDAGGGPRPGADRDPGRRGFGPEPGMGPGADFGSGANPLAGPDTGRPGADLGGPQGADFGGAQPGADLGRPVASPDYGGRPAPGQPGPGQPGPDLGQPGPGQPGPGQPGPEFGQPGADLGQPGAAGLGQPNADLGRPAPAEAPGPPVPADPARSPRTTDSWAFDPDSGTVHRAGRPVPDTAHTATFEVPTGQRPPGWEDQPVAFGNREPEPQAPPEPEEPARISPRWTFGDLVARAGIPEGEYAVEEEVDGAFCLVTADDGFDVFYSEHGGRHNLQHFDDEQAAFYYLFGRLAAVALRSGRLNPPR